MSDDLTWGQWLDRLHDAEFKRIGYDVDANIEMQLQNSLKYQVLRTKNRSSAPNPQPELKQPRKHKATVYLWSDGIARFHGDVFTANPGDYVVEVKEIEWDATEPIRVANYLIPGIYVLDNDTEKSEFKMFLGNPDDWYFKETYTIGQQPDYAILIPNSERSQD